MTETISKHKTYIDPFSLPEAQPVVRLMEAKRAGRNDVVENCHFCKEPIEMNCFERVSFRWRCPRGKSDGFFYGL